jgi:hypothetical protein
VHGEHDAVLVAAAEVRDPRPGAHVWQWP